ncbi:VOC family protein [Streptomyces sp. NPDC005962]|uniref:VOC family protein n=1 Tax=Streptomyces sp. NPDC005962 TaxID=3154466 RepID=UPI0033FDF2AB
MVSVLQNVAIDCADAYELARFWSEVLGSPNRIHLCLRPKTTCEEEVERLLGLGATLVTDRQEPDGTGWAVLADPEGNEFFRQRWPAGSGRG